MSDEKKSWDDIPSIDGLAVDHEYTPETSEGKRAYARMHVGDLTYMLEMKEILVRVLTGKSQLTGRLNDLSQGGMAVLVKQRLATDQPVGVGFFLNKEKIVAKAQVRQVREMGGEFLIGLEFTELDEEKSKYIAGVYASKVLNIK